MKYYLEINVILCNFFSDSDLSFEIENFSEISIEELKFNESILDYLRINNSAQIISTNFMRSLYKRKDKEGLFYRVLKYKKQIDNEIALNYYLDKYIEDIKLDVDELEAYFRIITNLHIMFGNINAKILDENNMLINSKIFYKNYPSILRYKIGEYEDIYKYNRLFKFKIKYVEFIELTKEIKEFKNCVNFFNSSFEQENISLKFLLLISSLESLFNNNKKRIAYKIRVYGSKFLFDYQNESENKKFFNKVYSLRSEYIRGKVYEKDLKEYEKQLREKVRMIILSYFFIGIKLKYIKNTNVKHTDIMKSMRNPNKDEKIITNEIANYINVLCKL